MSVPDHPPEWHLDLTIDGQGVQVFEGTTLLKACRSEGIAIYYPPTVLTHVTKGRLAYDDELSDPSRPLSVSQTNRKRSV